MSVDGSHVEEASTQALPDRLLATVIDKKSFSEQDIRTKFITPALQAAGWDVQTQIREEVTFTAGRVIVRGKLCSRGQKKRADYILYHKPNLPIALIASKGPAV